MNKRLYLFYQKQTLKEFWTDSTLPEKILIIFWAFTALAIGVLCAAITILASDRLCAGILLSAIWLFLFPGSLLCGQNIEKSYWVEFRETYAVRHGDQWASEKTKKIFYEEARYIVTGDTPPFITPRHTSPEQYHKKYGNYINVTNEKNKVLLTVRYSEETLELLKEKCINAKVQLIKPVSRRKE